MPLKYALYPGYVTSKKDGDLHFIRPVDLAMCYGVSLKECLIVHHDSPVEDRRRLMEIAGAMKLIPLHPRYYGDYHEHLEEALYLAGEK